ncbi:hypothetical protein [Mediterraneibacter sp. 210702-DFI.5.30]|uniref:hypothetical protein n=1 Tax=Mediterraneibacter sp. 210702-DFI.5.30 TaxID=2883232 RepID=UPI001D094B00|nr:hypothetical protein [Mediterraneibacter sp. 210702-DFI.5.30]MCB6621006.1 hypothetical protein [Mediterraneibacter sp. 210702-DFI.5.30]
MSRYRQNPKKYDVGTYAGVGTKVLIPVFSLYVRSYGVIGDQAGLMKQWRDINKKTAGATNDE